MFRAQKSLDRVGFLAVLGLVLVPAPASPQTGPISGYMDFHVNKPTDLPAAVDFHRFVLLFSHRFSDRLRFVGELELEHAVVEGLEKGGEIELEQAYIDFLAKPSLNFR